MKPKYIALLLFLLATCFAVAQTTIEISEYNVDNGLSQSQVTFIEQDSRGFLWVGTGEGLNRFDGYEFKQYFIEVGNTQSLNNNSIRGLKADNNGGVWVGTDMGLNYYNPINNSFERHELYKQLGHMVYSPAVVSDSFVFGICTEGLVFMYNPITQTTKLFPFPLIQGKFRPHGDKNGNIWFEMDNHTLLQFDTKQLKFKIHTINLFIESFNLNKDKVPTIYTSDKAYTLQIVKDSLHLKPMTIVMHGPVKMATSDNNCIWSIDINNQLNCLLFKKNQAVNNTAIGNALNIVQTMYIDRVGTLWIATDGNGLLKVSLRKQLFKSYNITPTNTISNNFIKCIIEGPDQCIYVGTLDQGIVKYSPNLSTYERVKTFTNDSIVPIHGLLFDKEENLWIVTDKQVLIHLKNGKIITINQPYCKGVQPWGQNILVRGFKKIMLFSSTDTSKCRTISLGHNPRYIYPLNQKELFISFNPTGAGIYNIQTSKFTTIFPALAGVKVTMLSAHSNNKYYLASDAGIIMLDKHFGIIETFNRKNGLPDHFVYSLLADNKGMLWGSTNHGIFSFNTKNKNIQSFGLNDGLLSLEFNSNAYLIDKKGRFHFGGIKGFSTIAPNDLVINKSTVPVYLHLIRTNNKVMVPSDKTIILKSNDNDVYVEFALPELLGAKRNRLSIFLKGLHTDWQTLNYKRSAKFESLAPGKYELLAKSINSDGIESDVYTLSQFKIAYPFWKNPIYMAILSVLTIAFFSFITLLVVRTRHRTKIAVLQKKNEIEGIRKNIYRDLHDEIGAGLSRIKILSDIALIEKDDNEHSLELVKESATEITEKLREIVWSMNQENENLSKLSQKLQTTAEVLFSNLDIQLVLTLDPTIPEIELPPIKIRNILMVYREIINNIIKHSQATKVTISIAWEKPIFSILVNDNGKGFNTDVNFKDSNGLKIIKDRMEEINAEYAINSQKGVGTETIINVPVNNIQML